MWNHFVILGSLRVEMLLQRFLLEKEFLRIFIRSISGTVHFYCGVFAVHELSEQGYKAHGWTKLGCGSLSDGIPFFLGLEQNHGEYLGGCTVAPGLRFMILRWPNDSRQPKSICTHGHRLLSRLKVTDALRLASSSSRSPLTSLE